MHCSAIIFSLGHLGCQKSLPTQEFQTANQEPAHYKKAVHTFLIASVYIF